MLVLFRKVEQKIKIGDDITLTVVSLAGGGVRIGIDAPREMKVMRMELLETQKQNIESIEDVDDGKALELLKVAVLKR